MIARSGKTALATLLVLMLAGLAMPISAGAHERDSDNRGSWWSDHDDDDRGRHVRPPRYGWARQRGHHYLAPRQCRDEVRYRPTYPRVYYYSPAAPVYSREYGSVGLHLDYNYLY